MFGSCVMIGRVTVPSASRTSELRGSPQHNVPMPLTSLIGRSRELDGVSETLRRTRLVTLTGPGGVGKTRLAIEVARRQIGRRPDGVWLVDLTAGPDPAAEVARTLDVGGRSPAAPTRVAAPLPRRSRPAAGDRQLRARHRRLREARVLTAVLVRQAAHPGNQPRIARGERRDRLATGLTRSRGRVPAVPRAGAAARTRVHPGCRRGCDDRRAVRATRPSAARDRARCGADRGHVARGDPRRSRGKTGRAWRRVAALPDSPQDGASRRRVELRAARPQPSSGRTGTWPCSWAASTPARQWQSYPDSRSTRSRGSSISPWSRAARPRVGLRGTGCSKLSASTRTSCWWRAASSRRARERHLHHYLAVAEQADPGWPPFITAALLDQRREDYENIRAALEWSVESDPCAGMRLLAGSRELFQMLGTADGRRLAQLLLARCRARDRCRIEVLITAGILAMVMADPEASHAFHSDARRLSAELGELELEGFATFFRGLMQALSMAVDPARADLEAAIRLAPAREQPRWRGHDARHARADVPDHRRACPRT